MPKHGTKAKPHGNLPPPEMPNKKPRKGGRKK